LISALGDTSDSPLVAIRDAAAICVGYDVAMTRTIWILSIYLTACGPTLPQDPADLAEEAAKLPSSLSQHEFGPLPDRDSIRELQFWIDDATFDTKWTTMLATPIDFIGGSDSAFHADLATLPAKRLPGKEVLCHGDPKLDNFGWTLVDGAGVFSDNDFDDSGYCPVAADILRFIVATDLWFGDPDLDSAAIDAYVATVDDKDNAVTVDPSDEPAWADARAKKLAKETSGDLIVLGGEVQAATADEIAAVDQLVDDWRFPPTILDVTRDVHSDGGSAGLRRFWALTEDYDGTRTIIELKELTIPGTELGRHSIDIDGPDRFDILKPYWWGSAAETDHYIVDMLDSRFVARDRMTRTNPDATKLSSKQLDNMIRAEASLLALRHRKAWGKVHDDDLTKWLTKSGRTLSDRWRAAYLAAGGA
jgi:hypothetical protein